MEKYDNIHGYKWPVITDNLRFREELPEIGVYFDAARKEIDDLPKENGIIVDPGIVVTYSDCPVCGFKHIEQLFIKYGFVFAECSLCTHVFVKNRLREKILLDLYAKSDVDKLDRKIQQSDKLQDYWSKVYLKYLGYFKNSNIINKNILDVGCGTGEFLKFCKEKSDFMLHGLDFCEDSFDVITQMVGKGNYYFQQKLEDTHFDQKKFGLITLWGVLEHVANPGPFMKKCHEILDENGYILALVPNIHSRAFKILGIDTPTLNPRAHIHFFTSKSINVLCLQTKLRIVDVFQELPVIDLMYPYVDFSDDLIHNILDKNESYYHVYILGK